MSQPGAVKLCKFHRWDHENWLPLIQGSKPEDYPAMTCQTCGRVLAVMDTSPNMRASIATSIASRLKGGDEYDEVFSSVMAYFNTHLTRQAA